MSELKQALREVFAEKTCVVGVGNPYRCDDAVGPLVAEKLKKSLTGIGQVVNVEDVIENYVFDIAGSDYQNILLVDAVSGHPREAGTVILDQLSEIEKIGGEISTHKLALSTAAKIFRMYGKKTFLLGIIPKNIDYGTEISPEIKGSVETVIEMIEEAGRVA
jgi:hydrogenase maturation protease